MGKRREKTAERTPEPPATGREEQDRELARLALQKQQLGKRPTVREAAALRRVRTAEEDRIFRAKYRRIPFALWREMSGRQAKVLYEQAARYGIPFGQKEIDLPAVVRALHDFLARNAGKLAAADEPTDSPWLERQREETYRLKKLEREEREASLVKRTDVRESLMNFAHHIRTAAEILDREHGKAAAKVLTDALDDAQTELDSYYGNPANDADG